MILEILQQTPIFVWVILALLVVRGLALAKPREGSLGSFFILPVILVAVGIQGMMARYGSQPLPWLAWVGGLLVFGVLGWFTVRRQSVLITPKGVRIPGSYWPLAFILAVFLVRYVSEVMLHIRPDVMAQPLAVFLLAAMYGVVTGVFGGRLAHIYAQYSSQRRGAPGNQPA